MAELGTFGTDTNCTHFTCLECMYAEKAVSGTIGTDIFKSWWRKRRFPLTAFQTDQRVHQLKFRTIHLCISKKSWSQILRTSEVLYTFQLFWILDDPSVRCTVAKENGCNVEEL